MDGVESADLTAVRTETEDRQENGQDQMLDEELAVDDKRSGDSPRSSSNGETARETNASRTNSDDTLKSYVQVQLDSVNPSSTVNDSPDEAKSLSIDEPDDQTEPYACPPTPPSVEKDQIGIQNSDDFATGVIDDSTAIPIENSPDFSDKDDDEKNVEEAVAVVNYLDAGPVEISSDLEENNDEIAKDTIAIENGSITVCIENTEGNDTDEKNEDDVAVFVDDSNDVSVENSLASQENSEDAAAVVVDDSTILSVENNEDNTESSDITPVCPPTPPSVEKNQTGIGNLDVVIAEDQLIEVDDHDGSQKAGSDNEQADKVDLNDGLDKVESESLIEMDGLDASAVTFAPENVLDQERISSDFVESQLPTLDEEEIHTGNDEVVSGQFEVPEITVEADDAKDIEELKKQSDSSVEIISDNSTGQTKEEVTENVENQVVEKAKIDEDYEEPPSFSQDQENDSPSTGTDWGLFIANQSNDSTLTGDNNENNEVDLQVVDSLIQPDVPTDIALSNEVNEKLATDLQTEEDDSLVIDANKNACDEPIVERDENVFLVNGKMGNDAVAVGDHELMEVKLADDGDAPLPPEAPTSPTVETSESLSTVRFTISSSSPESKQSSASDDMPSDEDRDRWLKVTMTGGVPFMVDLKSIKPYKKFISFGGFTERKEAIIVLTGAYLPLPSEPNYTHLLNHLFHYVINAIDLLAPDEYVIVYFHCFRSSGDMPPLAFCSSCYGQLDIRLRKSAKAVYVVHSNAWIKTASAYLSAFKQFARRKLIYVQNLASLKALIPTDYLFVEDAVKDADRTTKKGGTAPAT